MAPTGIAPSTIGRGLKEMAGGVPPSGARLRQPGGGRKRLTHGDPLLEHSLLGLVSPMTLGCPDRPSLWVSKSLEKLAAALRDKGHRVSANEGCGHPNRDAQFEPINAQALAFQAAGAPVISVDTKEKELIGPYKNGGTDWRHCVCTTGSWRRSPGSGAMTRQNQQEPQSVAEQLNM